MGTLHLILFIIKATTMVPLVLSLLLPFMALAAPGSQERGLLGDLITAPFDIAGCLSKCPISPLEFPGCSVDCAKETNSGDNRGLLGDLITSPFDFAGCLSKCPISPLEFPGCSVDCAKETNSGDNRGLLGDLITSPFDFAGCLS